MGLLTKAQTALLIKNGLEQQDVRGTDEERDFHPVVKLFTPDAQATWLLTEIYPDDNDVAFGLCDLGMGFPEAGDVRLSEIASVRGSMRLPVEVDRGFSGDHPLSVYIRVSRQEQRIITSDIESFL